MTQATHEELSRRVLELEDRLEANRQTIADLSGRERLFREMLDSANDLIHSVTPEGRFLYVNRAWLDALGYSPEEVENLRLMDIIDEDCRDKCRDVFSCLIKGDKLDRNETVFVARDGSRLLVEGRCSTKFKDGVAVSMTGIFRDVSERSRNEQALRESEERFRDLFENTSDVIQMVRQDGRLIYVNRAWLRTFGYSLDDVEKGLFIFDLITPACQTHCANVFHEVLREGKVNQINTAFRTKGGSEVFIEGNAICKFKDGKPQMTQCIFRNVTEKRRMEAELLKALKLESIGVFAGGIAHDFNNLLTAILGNVSIVKMYIGADDKARKRLDDMEKATLRAKSLTQQLLTFSKGGVPIKKKTSIGELIRDSSSFALMGGNVRCEYQLDDGLWPIEVDEGQLSQVTQNLVINACQAMPEGGVIEISASNVRLRPEELPRLAAGDYVRIAVRDHGFGISPEHLDLIFDPYFSSKPTGSGLGLAIAYSIIKNHDGLITVDSRVGQGSTFSIYLPANDKAASAQEEEQAATWHGKGRILVMDDEELILVLAVEMLSILGYEGVTARDGAEAIRLYVEAKAANNPFDALIMDLTIQGGMGGKEAIERLRAIDPEVKAVVSSGYANDPIMANYRSHGFSAVVPKPYMVSDMSQALAALLSGNGREDGANPSAGY